MALLGIGFITVVGFMLLSRVEPIYDERVLNSRPRVKRTVSPKPSILAVDA